MSFCGTLHGCNRPASGSYAADPSAAGLRIRLPDRDSASLRTEVRDSSLRSPVARLTRSSRKGTAGECTCCASLTRTVARLVVFVQQVASEVAIEIAPHTVDVVRVVLRIIVFNQKVGRLHAVIVRLGRIGPAGPREVDVVPGCAD